MIATLKGHLTAKSPGGIVVETGGIGYEVLVPLTTLYQLPETGTAVELTIHTHIRENQVLLIGFLEHRDREAFRLLSGVNGIGARLAVNILSGLPSDELMETIFQQDTQRLQKIPGVGKKMAERMVVELKDKLPARDVILGRKDLLPKGQRLLFSEALSALMNLGYKRKEAEKAIEEGLRKHEDKGRGEPCRLEDLLKATLRLLAKE